jgi:CRISPR-associated protein Csd2
MTEAIKNRYEFVLLFDVKDGNPNGDPDAGNLPRLDPETGNGLVTDVCLKRKVRNYIQQTKQSAEGFKIFVEDKAVLNERQEAAFTNIPKDEIKKGKEHKDAKSWMCANYFDIRTFGAVMTTGDYNCGQVLGATQLTFSRSIDRIFSQEHAITRMAVTNEKDRDKERTIGRKYTVPYGLYRGHGFISANFAEKTGFSQNDLKLLFEALTNMFDLDRSASRGEMATRKLIIFEHNSAFGEAPAHKLFGKIKIEKKKENEPPRSFDAYEITFHNNEGITEALNSDQTVITISVKEGGELELNTSPDWNK